ncbi:hypothetical protein [Litorivita sp. NS0012-18]|uniref:hypothetical protein n=1 Tax=Litorivita sp. NS0012-18 TaxID=3127655 RepID=UPI00310452BE
MARIPEEGVFTQGKIDASTGARWIYVTPQMARAHPKGRLSLGLWLIVTYFIAVAALRIIELAQYEALPVGAAAVLVAIPLLCALLLALRAPWGAVLVIILSVLSVVGSLSRMGGADPIGLINTLVLIAVAVYLHEGDRPNLIYRHRYRSYKSKEGADGAAK